MYIFGHSVNSLGAIQSLEDKRCCIDFYLLTFTFQSQTEKFEESAETRFV